MTDGANRPRRARAAGKREAGNLRASPQGAYHAPQFVRPKEPTRLSTARYEQVKEHVLRRIASGSLKVADRVPSENELVSRLKVSRMTANRALRELANEGYLVRIAGVGTFVAERRVHAHPLEVHNIADEVRARGHEYQCKVLKLEEKPADETVAARFGVPEGAPLFHSVLLHFEGTSPLQLEDRYVNAAVVPGYLKVDFTRQTPHEYLMRQAPLHRAEHTVQAIVPEARIAKLLKMGPAEASLLVRRRTWSNDRLASVADLYYPGARYELSGTFKP